MSVLNEISKDWRLAWYYGQKAIRSPGLRQGLGRMMVGLQDKGPARGPAPNAAVVDRMARDLRRDGFAAMPDKTLSAQTLADIGAHFKGVKGIDYYGSGALYDLDQPIPEDVIKLRYDNRDVTACRPLMDVANDPDVLAAVARHLGARPTIATAEAWWTLGESNAQGLAKKDDVFHRDVDDLRFVKLFIYLTDTDLLNGAHCFVLGSHDSAEFTRRGPISDSEVAATYPPERLHSVVGKAGTVFLEDTWGIHRALLATQGRRLIFSVLYGLGALVPGGPSRPMWPCPPEYDPRVNRRLYYPAS
ncbi:MAG: phytanoyl-CoA dioxygenase family protein [Burkholderiaceae bacterium]|nr:phytanoyl-CoA dioxygenase family protein [Burkholderiaceae bacterium]